MHEAGGDIMSGIFGDLGEATFHCSSPLLIYCLIETVYAMGNECGGVLLLEIHNGSN